MLRVLSLYLGPGQNSKNGTRRMFVSGKKCLQKESCREWSRLILTA